MTDIQGEANELVSNVALRGEKWWFEKDNTLRIALDKIPMPTSFKVWVGDVAIQVWTEGAITAVQEYGDEVRATECGVTKIGCAERHGDEQE